MKKYTKEILTQERYNFENARITNVSLNMRNHACLTLDLSLEGDGWGVVYGGFCLGRGYLGADEDKFKGSAAGEKAIMMIMDTVGVDDLFEMKNKYVRVASKNFFDQVRIIGNITKDKWFDYTSFFEDEKND